MNKPWWQSRTIWIGVTQIVVGLAWLGLGLAMGWSDTTQGVQIAQLGLAGLGVKDVFLRWVTKQPIGKT